MKITSHLIIGVIVYFTSVVFISCNQKDESKENSDSTPSEKEMENQENPFTGLRSMALSMTPDQIGVEIPEGETKVFGLIMDWDLGDGIVTLSAYETGDASMYLSSGSGVIGGGKHENVRQAVLNYIELGQEFLPKSEQTESTPLPDKGCIRFYFLTNNGIYFVQETMENIENENSNFLKLFEEANMVLSELRKISENS